MELVYTLSKEDYENKFYTQKKNVILYTWNSLNESNEYMLVLDSNQLNLTIQYDSKGHIEYVCECIEEKAILLATEFKKKGCIHVLMNTSMIDEKWCYPTLKKYIKPSDEVCVFAFSFFDDTKNVADWNKQYAPGQGIWYRANTDVFFKYGIKPNQIHWVNYFTDSKVEMENKILSSSIILFTGGAPDLMMNRIKEFKLKKILKNYQGLMMGYSAGAMIQLDEYHITPDDDYPEFCYKKGLGCIDSFKVEVHYHASNIQKKSISRVIQEKNQPVYAIYEDGGVIVDEKSIEFFGNVELFTE